LLLPDIIPLRYTTSRGKLRAGGLMVRAFFLSLVWGVSFLSSLSAAVFPYKANPSDIRVVPVDPTPESETVKLDILFPERSEVKQRDPVRLQLRIAGYPLATNSDFPRKEEIRNDPKGQTIHVTVDDMHYFSIDRAMIQTVDSREHNYFTQLTEVSIPFDLKPGEHVIRAFAVRSYNESLKGTGAFALERFYFQTKVDNLSQNLNDPFLTYNAPAGKYPFKEGKPILLDFYVANTQLSDDGYKVELTIDGTVKRLLTRWVPYYIYGLKAGDHTIRLRLLDPKNRTVKGIFNIHQDTITVQ